MANGNFAGGNGTEASPYLIEDAFDLDAVRNDLTAHYKLINDIDLDIAPFNTGEGWVPIGDNSTDSDASRFSGSFDGNSKVIFNLFINRPSSNNQGLFGYTNGSTIKNIGLENIDITGYTYTGGLVGLNQAASVLENSYSTGSITGNHYTGGLVGSNLDSSVIKNSYSTGSVTGGNRVGGLVGNNLDSSVINSYSTGNATGLNHTGGLVGYNYNASVINSYSTGNVTGKDNTGGLVGNNLDSSVIENSYSTGSVTGGTYIGGLVGRNQNSSVINSYWDTQTSGQATSRGGTGLTTAQMQTAQTFIDAGWDEEFLDDGITPVWRLSDGEYPKLWFEEVALYLIEDGDDIKSYDGDSWSVIGVKPVTEQMFLDHGMVSINAESLQALGSNSKLLYWTDAEDAEAVLQSTRIPKPVLVKPTGDIDLSNVMNIHSFTLTATTAGVGVLKVLVSTDQGTTWKAWDGVDWAIVNTGDLAAVKANGMDVETFNTIASEDWNVLKGESDFIRFAYYLEIETLSDVAATDKLQMEVDMGGTWDRADESDYTYRYTTNTSMEFDLLTSGDFKINY